MINSNQLKELDFSKNINLRELDCSNNHLDKLDLSKNINLTKLDCHYSELKSLDISKNINLSDLNCYNNYLTSLDVSKNSNLTDLECSDNSILFVFTSIIHQERGVHMTQTIGNLLMLSFVGLFFFIIIIGFLAVKIKKHITYMNS